MWRRILVLLVIAASFVPFLVRAQEQPGKQVTLNFDELPPGPVAPEGILVTTPVEGGGEVTLRFRREGDPLEIRTIGLPGWGAGSLSTFHFDPGAPNGAPVEIEVVSVPWGYGVEKISFQMGDFEPSDIDDLFTSTTAGPMDAQIAGTVVITPDRYDEPRPDPSFASATITRQRAWGIKRMQVSGGSFNFPGSVFYDNFTITLRPTDDGSPFGAFAAGTDAPESDFGGDPINDQFSTNSGEGGEVIVYGVEQTWDSLYKIDLETGDTTLVGALGGTTAGAFQVPTGMAIRPSDGKIFIWNNPGSSDVAHQGLATVDPETGEATLVANSDIRQGCLAFDANGVLYAQLPEFPDQGQGLGPGPLVIVNQTTAEMEVIDVDSPLPNLTGLDYNKFDGYLYGITANFTLVKIDRQTGALVSSFGIIQPYPPIPPFPNSLFFDSGGGLHATTLNNQGQNMLFDIIVTPSTAQAVNPRATRPFSGLGTTGAAAAPVVTPVAPTVSLLLNGQPFEPGGQVEWVNGKTLTLTVVGADGNFDDDVVVKGYLGSLELTGATDPSLSAQVGDNPGQREFSWTPAGQTGPVNLSFTAESGSDVATLGLTLLFPAGDGGADTDGDGLLDDWENNGYDFTKEDGTVVHVDLPGLGADPNVKDLFLVVDYMVGEGPNANGDNMVYDHRPTDAALQLMKEAFTPPVGDPRAGKRDDVNLHVLVRHKLNAGSVVLGPDGNPLPRIDFVTQLGQIGSGNYVWTNAKGTEQVFFDDIKNVHFAQELRQAMYYCVFAHTIGGSYTGMARGAPESDCIVSLGDILEYRSAVEELTPGSVVKPTAKEQCGTLMHEVGHCLGLHHGGAKVEYFKPNYLSVMNLPFQLSGLRFDGADGLFDYSWVKLNDLDEKNLNETVGLTAPAGVDISRYGTTWFFRPGEIDAGVVQRWTSAAAGPVNWYVDSYGDPAGEDVFEPLVEVDLNQTGTRTILEGYNDWANLNFLGGVKGTGVQLPRPTTSPAEGLTLQVAITLQPAGFDELYVHHAKGKNVLTWKPVGSKNSGITYNVRRSTNGGAFELLANVSETNYHDTALTDGETYAYTVNIVSASGQESAGPERIIETPKNK